MRVLNVSEPWWARHVEHTISFIEAVKAGDREEATKALTHLARMLGQWADIVSSASGRPNVGTLSLALMAEHLVGVKLATEGAMEGRPDDVNVAVEMLKRNVASQAELYGASVRDFPEDEFQDLFGRHVDLAAERISALAADDEDGFAAATEASRANGAELDGFTETYLVGRRS
jgi:DNA-binding GntR family transcriptional regulator